MIILGFGLTIFVHEMGHFLMARKAGVRVLVFSIGMGPRLFTVLKDKKGTEWILSAIPIGGYVKMLGQEDLPGTVPEHASTSDNYQSKTPWQKLGVIMAGVTMNVIFAYFLLVIAFSVGVPFTSNTIGGTLPNYPAERSGLKAGDTVIDINGQRIETWEDMIVSVSLSSPSEPLTIRVDRDGELLSFQTSTTDSVTIDGETINLPVPELGLYPYKAPMVSKLNDADTLKKIGLKPGQIVEKFKVNGGVFTTADGIQQAVIFSPESSFEMRVRDGDELRTVSGNIASKTVFEPGYQQIALISPMVGGASEKAGLKHGDVIKKIGKQVVRGWDDLQKISAGITHSSPIPVVIEREGKEIIKTIRPQYNPRSERYLLGIRPTSDERAKKISYVEPWLTGLFNAPKIGDKIVSFEKKTPSFWEKKRFFSSSDVEQTRFIYTYAREGVERKAIVLEQLMETKEIGYLIHFSYAEKMIKYPFYQSLYKSIYRGYLEIKEAILFLVSLLKGNISMEMVGGPIKIFEISHIVAEAKGWGYFLLLFAKIGFSLAIINSLPIPVLDGGHAVFILYEMIRGRPAHPNVVIVLHYIGFITLISLFAFVMYNDIASLIMQ